MINLDILLFASVQLSGIPIRTRPYCSLRVTVAP